MSYAISEIYPLVHPEIQKDIDKYIKNDMIRFKDVFCNRIYYRHLVFNYLLRYSRSSDRKYILYTGGLGMGHFINICYTINNHSYSIELCDILDNGIIYYESNDWLSIKDKVDKYFESIMREDSVLKLVVPLTQIYKKELIKAAHDYEDHFKTRPAVVSTHPSISNNPL